MKKAAIAFVALPLLCLGAGYGAGLALAPTPAEAAGTEVDEKAAHGAEESAKDAAHAPETDAHGEDGEKSAKGKNQEPMGSSDLTKDHRVVRLGRMTVPVEKTNSVSYVVADFALKMGSPELAERYRSMEDAMRMRDSLLQAMNLAAESAVLRGASIDSLALSQMLRDLISKEHKGVDDVMFISLYMQDVARL